MKLELSRVVQGCRLGLLTGLGKSGQHSLEVPGCLLYTRCATVPHLTQDTLHTLRDLPSVTQVSVDSLAEHHEVLKEFKEGVRKFSGLHDTVLFCSLHDSANSSPAGHVTNKTVSVWGSGGRIELTVARFIAIQAAIQPDCYQSMADGETWQAGTSRKRVRKAVDRTLAHLDECLALHQKTQELKKAEIFGVVEGGDILEERLRSARETAKRPVGGFVLDGFHSAAMDQDVRVQLIKATSAELPQEKPRLVLGVGRPDEVISCVEAGVDLFESFFPFQVTERGCALSFNYTIDPDPETAGTSTPTVLEFNGERPAVKKLNSNGDENMTPYEMNLKDKWYQDDFRPLVEGCSCYCCKKHMRAYVHHLLVTNELLGGVLLMLHNMAHYLGFFKALREAITSDRLQDFKNRVLHCREVD
ncbi:queuine tRNA-ribosyltransferase subunit qtrtd1-like isoform X1 [Sinocyclocheilus grahami]|uniref:Queuine tRNA-ribosyltransferase accessory subunit 2 n=1 Tax=Sinocyclocheilus grahami TaxID=75366 RepID=A0A672NI52_SINGR|nr:PREDICTED: queuine tRNA-ribosyltransferase subunit qtrtd1-like isoform X1 [Sinocyclocheilus grahami]XP_016135829.1 PREDICTED: queuine tRNA-ribosyltransferase subunit qtrtd1-like isoform X1 [Sinocyclocheilus grahami]XP_016135830.1 PREDICTED: queuine tRNA-ribosyltransferase subunit qtrtd1-like isoform X1 [Sinocyclocheilus grahami]